MPHTATTRLAPSPTGALHLGNARTFLINWALARQRGWRIVLRIEDLDTPRVKSESIAQTIDILRWLGIDWDDGPLIQSEEPGPAHEAMSRLAHAGEAYPCALTRAQIEAAASAPQEGVHEPHFPIELRPALSPVRFDRPDTNWRFAAPSGAIEFHDEVYGTTRVDVAGTVGDFVIWTKRGQPSYQLAVVVDDARQGVTHVVRGSDLLESTARQILLYRALGLGPPPHSIHLPLVVGADGLRLAKRHGDTRLAQYRDRGADPQRIIGLIAAWSGVGDPLHPREITADTFMRAFDLRTMPRGNVTFREEDDRWALSDG
ncbi:MAG: tRNA glutamyl-Q(34) synthetase GluQRS [Phycisphaeraceae bacterium]|nr:tRNA glutamyl-Q(34) synthetase GluQRS [Phycisphaeraceae bacterium]